MKNEAMDTDINETNSQCILGSNLNSAAIICTQNSTLTNQILSNEALENTLLNTSPLSTSSNGNAAEMHSNDSGDAEGVWSPDIDQAFHEALQIYPPCGRRKIILSDEGKMYGRNELIARYIKIRCGKTRTRKQVSSHIQVLARKKQREEQARTKHSNSEINCESIPVNFPLRTNESTNLNSILTDQSSVDELLRSDTSIESRSQNYPINTQPFINLLTKDQIASMRAQVLKAASAMPAKGATNTNWLCTLTAGNFNQLDTKFSIPTTNSIDIIKNIANSDRVLLSSNISQCETILPSTSTSANNFALASSKLILSGFTAYIEQNLKNAPTEGNRIEIVHIPKTSSAPLEKINLDLIQAKYPPILQELFKKGPTDAFFLSKCWTNMNFDIGDEQNTLFAVDSYYEAIEKFDIVVSSKVCSFGNEVVEKVEIYSPVDDDDSAKLRGIWHFKLEKSPMCEYMVRFISELKKLHEPSLMNSVLENFTVLQIVTDKQTGDTLMVIAFVFEIRDDGEDEIFTNIYRLTQS